ncbi:hypothetical protein N7457_001605 [Penicillium paradoxum]|uniref:uncharacterized protein n=1 Tax=Penicillium paradoxum TaxID=176176 RepID=UPI002548B855|nr:uncharacterized protein N7457_001605 [Penicillium paradoxum]KAJ5795006.1 hypothetical protein N7457_001605 [Penicillium paradoxum]
MAGLDQLPLELLQMIAGELSSEKDINALVQTTRTLYHHLHLFLYKHNIQHHQGSALLWAAKNGYVDLAVRLLDAGASIAAFVSRQEKAYYKATSYLLKEVENPLLFAAQGGHLLTLKSLLSETRSDRACSPAQLRTVLHWAICSRDDEIVDLMITHKAPLDPAGDHYDAFSALGFAVASLNNSIIPRLLEAGAQSGPKEYPCPVTNAIYTNQRLIVEILLKHGERAKSDGGLRYIARQNDKDLFQLLVKYDALEIEAFGAQAVFIAIMHGHCEMVELLIEKGANPHLSWELVVGVPHNSFWYSTIGFALHFEYPEIVKLLLAKCVCPSRSDLRFVREKKFATEKNKDVIVLLSEFSEESLPMKHDVETHFERQLGGRDQQGLTLSMSGIPFGVLDGTQFEGPEGGTYIHEWTDICSEPSQVEMEGDPAFFLSWSDDINHELDFSAFGAFGVENDA